MNPTPGAAAAGARPRNLCDYPLRDVTQMDKAYFRTCCPDVPDAEFDTKWNLIVSPNEADDYTGGMRLLRSFVRVYFNDFCAAQDTPLCPGFGDLHIQNFNHVQFLSSDEYVFSDFDDCGWCPVALDALRYFVVLKSGRLVAEDTFRALIKEYLDVVTGVSAPKELTPYLEHELFSKKKRKKRTRELLETWHTNGSGLFLGPEGVPPDLRAQVWAAFRDPAFPQLHPYTPLDIRRYTGKKVGGSGGLLRFWVLVEQPPKPGKTKIKQLVIELKQLTEYPGCTGMAWGGLTLVPIPSTQHGAHTVAPAGLSGVTPTSVAAAAAPRLASLPETGTLSSGVTPTIVAVAPQAAITLPPNMGTIPSGVIPVAPSSSRGPVVGPSAVSANAVVENSGPPEAIPLHPHRHVEWCLGTFWTERMRLEALDVQLNTAYGRFHVRSRIKGGLGRILKLPEHERLAVCCVQVGVAAAVHAPFWTGRAPGRWAEEHAEWMERNASFVAERYAAVFRYNKQLSLAATPS